MCFNLILYCGCASYVQDWLTQVLTVIWLGYLSFSYYFIFDKIFVFWWTFINEDTLWCLSWGACISFAVNPGQRCTVILVYRVTTRVFDWFATSNFHMDSVWFDQSKVLDFPPVGCCCVCPTSPTSLSLIGRIQRRDECLIVILCDLGFEKNWCAVFQPRGEVGHFSPGSNQTKSIWKLKKNAAAFLRTPRSLFQKSRTSMNSERLSRSPG